MIEVIGVKFKQAGKVYFFSPGSIDIDLGQWVIVETSRGVEIGAVVKAKHQVDEKEVIPPLRIVKRIADDKDLSVSRENERLGQEAFRICQVKIKEHQLEMKLVEAEYTFDRNKLLFYFTADGRVDFRGLVKDLATVFKTRIELRQIGVRDEAKMKNSIGSCGRALCCATYMTNFHPVSIKMAKVQKLSLNPVKISGICGRLMCCLKYEEETYRDLRKKAPKIGEKVMIPGGRVGEVRAINILRQQVKVVIKEKDNTEVMTVAAEELQQIKKCSCIKNQTPANQQADSQTEQEDVAQGVNKQPNTPNNKPKNNQKNSRQESDRKKSNSDQSKQRDRRKTQR